MLRVAGGVRGIVALRVGASVGCGARVDSTRRHAAVDEINRRQHLKVVGGATGGPILLGRPIVAHHANLRIRHANIRIGDVRALLDADTVELEAPRRRRRDRRLLEQILIEPRVDDLTPVGIVAAAAAVAEVVLTVEDLVGLTINEGEVCDVEHAEEEEEEE